MSAVIAVVGWDRFQHYSDRDPTWVKLYRDLLTSESWVLGTDLSRLVQVASILLAARYKNKIPREWRLIKKVAGFDCNEKEFDTAVSHLVSTKFLEIQSCPDEPKAVEHGASTVLEQSREERKEEKSRGDKSARARPAKRCPEDFVLDEELRTWAAEKFPGVSVEAETAAFRDHEYKTAKTDWRAAWRTWIRNAPKFGGSGSSQAQPRKLTRYEQMQETLRNATET